MKVFFVLIYFLMSIRIYAQVIEVDVLPHQISYSSIKDIRYIDASFITKDSFIYVSKLNDNFKNNTSYPIVSLSLVTAKNYVWTLGMGYTHVYESTNKQTVFSTDSIFNTQQLRELNSKLFIAFTLAKRKIYTDRLSFNYGLHLPFEYTFGHASTVLRATGDNTISSPYFIEAFNNKFPNEIRIGLYLQSNLLYNIYKHKFFIGIFANIGALYQSTKGITYQKGYRSINNNTQYLDNNFSSQYAQTHFDLNTGINLKYRIKKQK